MLPGGGGPIRLLPRAVDLADVPSGLQGQGGRQAQDRAGLCLSLQAGDVSRVLREDQS